LDFAAVEGKGELVVEEYPLFAAMARSDSRDKQRRANARIGAFAGLGAILLW
jgi:hypothetical protein